ncbi:hypothetical protein SLEP1_g7914 [Rubroshorea leprosula]|uniref:Reverse transcriptase domain-containing protein n=1 Tax=Rubroshorea leprosula TaxID=152421 RepID=A0AAV5I9W4_9ROSI|nr:hypothetical protein SLEP1_g7914 [Rubroshorea leprosula]
MRKVMNSIISQNQSAFIGGRHIADGIIITNELIHDAKRRKRPTLIFKADFEKAYDSVNWSFLDCMLQKLGFCEKWHLWIQEGLASATTSVLVNGSPTDEFKMSKGLQQGDPLAPFLFLVVAEALNGDKLSDMVDSINCVVGDIPFKYIGVPVGANPRKISTWAPVIECLRRKLSSWRCDSLSFGGRIILLKAVLSSIPVYYFSTLKAPKKVINLLSLIQRRFLWGGSEENNRISWVRWDSVYKSKDEGGLGVKNLGTFNVALLGKWRWRLLEEENALWRRVLEVKYKVNRINERRGGEWDVHGSSWWKELWRLDTMGIGSEGWLSENIEKVVRDGSKTLFWHDKWVGPIPLNIRFNRLFRISGDKDALISNMGEWEDGEWKWRWRWRRNLLAWELELLRELTDTLQGTAWLVWSSCYNWWGIAVPQHHEGWNHLQQHVELFSEEKSKQAWLVTCLWPNISKDLWLSNPIQACKRVMTAKA